jgi:hypothetical protein
MGFFVNLCGRFRCVKCGMESEACIQTKLFRTEADNSSREYRVGDSEIVDGMEDYCALYPWDGSEPLVVAVGDWGCRNCELGWQWARLVLTVNENKPLYGDFSATIRELSSLVPSRPSDLAGIHLVESWLSEMSGLWGKGPDYNWAEGRERWLSLPVHERCALVASGFRTWCREFARAELPPS